MTTSSNEFPKIKIGDRIEVTLQQPYGNPPWTLWHGYLVAEFNIYGDRLDAHDQMVILGDTQDGGGQPISFRRDQVFPEFGSIRHLGYTDKLEKRFERLWRERHRPRKWWNRLSALREEELDSQIETIQMSLAAFRLAQDIAYTLKGKPARSEIITRVGAYLKPGSPVSVRIPERSGGPITVNGKFVADFRGWRFFQFDHGGTHAYRVPDVQPIRKKRKVATKVNIA
jgi:hypothetical protein